MKHFFMGNKCDDFTTFIENIMYNKDNHHLVFDENNILKRINCLYGINDEIATITVGKQYDFTSVVPEPYYNYIFNNNIEISHILLDEKQYGELFAIGETIDHIYSFNDIDKDNFDEILKDIKLSYLTDTMEIKTEEVKQYCWKIFENYATDYFKIINVNEPKIYNKYDEDYHYEQIYDNIYDLQKLHKNNIMNEVIKKYKE